MGWHSVCPLTESGGAAHPQFIQAERGVEEAQGVSALMTLRR
jgi:hypothetical protein